MKLTTRETEILSQLEKSNWPLQYTGPLKAMGNKLLKKGLSEYQAGYPHGFTITDAGRAALKETAE